jgi:gliding motility associated protien GldN
MKRAALFIVGVGLMVLGLSAQQATNPTGVVQTTQPATTNTQLTLDTLKTMDVYEMHISQKKPIPYVPIREADVMWAKDIWRIIDLREKLNQPLYYPTKPLGKRMSLFSLIMHGIREYNLHAFKDDKYNLFSTETMIGEKEIVQALGADTLFPGTPMQEVRLKTDQVKQLLVKEKWFFDKQHSTMQVRIVGIAPIKVYNKTLIDANGNLSVSPEVSREILFWIYFPEYRGLFASNETYNRFNDAQNISFDDLFMQRIFSSYIYGESNVYENRFIVDYLIGDDILYEAERIKQSIFEMEHDLWEW